METLEFVTIQCGIQECNNYCVVAVIDCRLVEFPCCLECLLRSEIKKEIVNMSNYVITTTCPKCKNRQDIRVNKEGYHKWQDGMLIQKALPELSSNESEALITGICSTCWDELFSEKES